MVHSRTQQTENKVHTYLVPNMKNDSNDLVSVSVWGRGQGFVPISHPNPKPDNIGRVLGYLTITETHSTTIHASDVVTKSNYV